MKTDTTLHHTMLTTDRSGVFTFSADVTTQCARFHDVMLSCQPTSPTCVSADKASMQGSKGDRYKTELCRTYEEIGSCRYGDKCQFAHGVAEMRNVNRHPKYKTDLCRTFHTTGFCAYGARCHFIHGDYKQMMTSSSSPSSSSTSSPAGAHRQVPVQSRPSRDGGDVSRLLNGLDDGLLLALASLLQRHQVSAHQRATVADRTNLLRFSSFDPMSGGSSDSLSPCPSPSSVFGSGSSDGMCSPVGSTSPMMNPFLPSKTSCYSGCGSPDSTSSVFSNWIQPRERSVSSVSDTLAGPVPLSRSSYSLHQVARSIFA